MRTVTQFTLRPDIESQPPQTKGCTASYVARPCSHDTTATMQHPKKKTWTP